MRRVLITVTAVALTLWPAYTASASTGWKIQTTPNPASSNQNNLTGVWCLSATSCTAVGTAETKQGVNVTLAEHWNGSTWAIQATPNPAGSAGSSLTAVSCVLATSCTAVGWYTKGAGVLALAEHWNGTAWTMQAIPNPSGSTESYPAGISCTSATSCIAVGGDYRGVPEFALAERWNGSMWAVQSVPSPAGAAITALQGVSCTSATSCTATGGSRSGKTTVTLAERWNGTAWAIQATPNHAGSNRSSLGGVSCASPSSCTAVGSYGGSASAATLAEHWNGNTWAIQATPRVASGSVSYLGDVACPSSSTQCTAVGLRITSHGTGNLYTLIEQWTGTQWVIQPSPNQPGGNTTLSSVSCNPTTTCTAVGNYENPSFAFLTLAERD